MVKRFLAAAAALCLVEFGAAPAHAVIVPNLVSGSPTATTGGFTWTYHAVAQPDSLVAAGDFFTIYDFQGFDPANPNAVVTKPAGWSVATNLVTPPPQNIFAPDDPSLYNVTFQYLGTSITGNLGDFSIFSTIGQANPIPGRYAGQDHDLDGQFIKFTSTTPTPGVPEPVATPALLALTSLLSVRRRTV
jgi:hypothetical protein